MKRMILSTRHVGGILDFSIRLMQIFMKVCCNSCKKPVKASQFVVHAERCSSLSFTEELFPDLDTGLGNRKPPRKGRKKFVTAGNHVASTGAQERFAIVDASETAVSTSQLDDPAGHTSSCLVEAKG